MVGGIGKERKMGTGDVNLWCVEIPVELLHLAGLPPVIDVVYSERSYRKRMRGQYVVVHH